LEEVDTAKESRFGFKHRASKMRANTELISLSQYDFAEVTSMVNGLEANWKRNHSKVCDFGILAGKTNTNGLILRRTMDLSEFAVL
jgi:hypothetical protein